MQTDSDKCDGKREMSRAMEIASAPIYKENALCEDGERKATASNSFEKYCFFNTLVKSIWKNSECKKR